MPFETFESAFSKKEKQQQNDQQDTGGGFSTFGKAFNIDTAPVTRTEAPKESALPTTQPKDATPLGIAENTIKGIPHAGAELLGEVTGGLSKVADFLINKPIQKAGEKLAETKFIQEAAQGIDLGDTKGNFGEQILKRVASPASAFYSGLTGGIVNLKTEAPEDITGKVVDGIAGGLGTVVGIGKISKGLSALKTPVAVTDFLAQYPRVAKYAVPFMKNAGAFGLYGQLDPALADNATARFQKLATDVAMSVPFTGLGFVNKAAVGIPASFGLGYMTAKFSGASNEDALVSGFVLGVLDGAGRLGGEGSHFISGRIADRYVRQEAVDAINRHSDIKISANSSPEDIKAAYRSAAFKTHPDRGGDVKAFTGVQSAFDYLSGKTTTLPQIAKSAPTDASKGKPVDTTLLTEKAQGEAPDLKSGKLRAQVVALEEKPPTPDVVNELAQLRNQLNAFQQTYKENTVNITQGNQPVLSVDVVPYNDGKFNFSVSAGSAGAPTFSVPFLPSDVYSTKEEATKAALSVVEKWAQEQNNTAVLDAIKEARIKPSNVEVPAEVNAGELYTAGSKKTAEIFAKSTEQTPVAKKDGVTFELGTFGRNHQTRKESEAKFDRFDEKELKKTIENIGAAFRASDNPQMYRYDNIAWVARVDGKVRVIYTRKNASGAEEIIGWHDLTGERGAKYLQSLEQFGIPSRTRTGNTSLEATQFIQLAYEDIGTVPVSHEESKKKSVYKDGFSFMEGGKKYTIIASVVDRGEPKYLVRSDDLKKEFWTNGKYIDMAKEATAQGITVDELMKKNNAELGFGKKKAKPVKVADVSQEEVAKIMDEVKTVYKNAGMSEDEPTRTKADVELEHMMVEMLELSNAGFRFFDENVGEYAGVESTFPKWVPEELRSNDLFSKVFKPETRVDALKFPEGNRPKQRALMQAVLDDLDFRLGVDTSEARNKIIKLYEDNAEAKANAKKATSQQGAVAETSSGGTKGGEADIQSKIDELPDALMADAEADWNENYADKYDGIYTKLTKAQEKLKEAKASERSTWKDIVDKYNKELGTLEDTWIQKWQDVASIKVGDTVIAKAKNTSKRVEQVVQGVKPTGLSLLDEATGLPLQYPYAKWTFEKVKTSSDLAPAKSEKRAPSVSGGYASTGAEKIGNFAQKRVKETGYNNLKLFEQVQKLIEKYASTVGEGYLPRNAAGVFYHDTENIRVSGMNDLSVAAHEIAHFLDFKFKLTEKLWTPVGFRDMGENMPMMPIYDKELKVERKELTDIYARYYPTGRRDHPVKQRMVEGFATFIQKSMEMPETMAEKYPQLTKQFLKSGGKFYAPHVEDLLNDARRIVDIYQGLNPLDKIGARVTHDYQQPDKKPFLSFGDKVRTEAFDALFPIEKLAIQSGTANTTKDPSLWARMYNNSSALVLNNINTDRGYWGFRGGEFVKLHDYNWKTLIKGLEDQKEIDSFNYFLVARDQYFNYQELNKRKQLWEDLDMRLLKLQRGEPLEDGELPVTKSAVDEAGKAYKELKGILDRNGFTEKEATDAYEKNKGRFAKESEMFDALTREDLNFLNDPAVQLVDNAMMEKLTSREGYASMKRDFYDEIAGQEEETNARSGIGGVKASSLKERTGSSRAILPPLDSAVRNHAEMTKKGLKQIMWNRIGDIGLSAQFPKLFQRVELKAVPTGTGAIMFPQERDPDIIMARRGYKRVPILTDRLIKRVLDENINYQNIGYFEQAFLSFSRLFTKGTTGLFIPFSITNTVVDQITAVAQTQTKFVPIYSQVKMLRQLVQDKGKTDASKFFSEYLVLGGERQTFFGWQDLSPRDLEKKLRDEHAGMEKILGYAERGIDLAQAPAKWSEIMTRATEYVRARQNGDSTIVALEKAGRVTAPFHHAGRMGGRGFLTYVKSLPYFNATLQVLDQAARSGFNKDEKARQRFWFTVTAVTAAMLGSLYVIAKQGTQEQKDLYADLNPQDLARYVFLPNPNGKTLLKIRIPQEMSTVGALLNMAIADMTMNTKYNVGDYVDAGTAWLPQQLDFAQPKEALFSWITQMAKPAIEVAANVKDYPRVMPLESESQLNKPAGLRFTEGTSPVAKWLGKEFNISPIKIDYLATGYLGRSVGYLTAKPNVYNPASVVNQQYYFSSGRRLQDYYDMKKANDQLYLQYTHKLEPMKLGQTTRLLEQRAILGDIHDLVADYADVDVEKYPERAQALRQRILDRVDDAKKIKL